jgi:hypothetical protein
MQGGNRGTEARVLRAVVALGAALLLAVPPASAAGQTISAVAGQQFSGQVASSQTGCSSPSSPSGTIDWGDGSTSAAQVSVSGSALVISGSHTYAKAATYAGSVTGSYTCTSRTGPSQSPFNASFTAQVSDAASVSPTSLSFKVEVNEFNQIGIDSNPQSVIVTDTGTSPLTISGVKIVNSPGGFVINNACVSTLVNDAYTTTCKAPTTRADTCTGATLSVGASCAIAVEYDNAGLYPTASGSLEIDSNSPTTPDLVSLSGTSTFISAISEGAVPGGCPGVIADTEGPLTGSGFGVHNGSGILLGGCWTDNGIWGAVGPVTINGDVTLVPTNPGDELFVSPSFAGGTANDTIFATPSNARYVVQVAPPAASNQGSQAPAKSPRRAARRTTAAFKPGPIRHCLICEPGTTWALSGPNTEPLGIVDLGSHPFVCSHAWEDALAPNYVGCAGLLAFHADSPQDTIHGLPVVGGNILFAGCGSAYTSAYAALPKLFSTTPVAGSSPPTATFEFGGCSQPPQSTSSGGGSANPVTCPGKPSATPGCGSGNIIPNQPHVLRRATGSACPSGDVDYTAGAPESFVGAMDFGSPYLCYDPARDVWTAGGTVGVLGATVDTGPPPDFGIGFHSNGSFDHGGIQTVDFGSPGVVLAPAVDLNSFGGSFGVDPTRLQASATVTVGGVLKINGGAFAVWANPSHPYTYQPDEIPGVGALQTDTRPPNQLTDFAAGVGGDVSLGVPVIGTVDLASGYVFYAAPSYFEFAGCLGDCTNGLSLLGVATLYARAFGALDTGNGQYNIGGSARVCANFPVVGNVCPASLALDASNVGLGACGSFLGITGGAIVTYGQGVQIEGPFSCDLGPITVVVQRSRALDARVAHVAQGDGAVTLRLAGHPPSASIYVRGVGGPPILAVAGPHGERLSQTGAGQGVHAADLVIWPEPKLDETLVAIKHPAAGRWSLTPLPGSTTISKVAYAYGLPPANISATVSGRGHTRTLTYRIGARPGQRVTFAERAGRVFHILGTALGNGGRLRFSPAFGPGASREIVALISLSGRPVPPRTIARYAAPSPPTAGRPPHLTLARRGNALKISWGKTANAHGYLVAVALSDGLRASYSEPARQRSIVRPMVGQDVSARIRLFAIAATGAAGPPAVATLTPVRPPAKVTHLTIKRVRRTVVVAWLRSPGARAYMLLLQQSRPRGTIYAPTLLSKTRFVSKRTLPNLRAGSVVTITVTALGPTGAESPPSRIRYRAS